MPPLLTKAFAIQREVFRLENNVLKLADCVRTQSRWCASDGRQIMLNDQKPRFHGPTCHAPSQFSNAVTSLFLVPTPDRLHATTPDRLHVQEINQNEHQLKHTDPYQRKHTDLQQREHTDQPQKMPDDLQQKPNLVPKNRHQKQEAKVAHEQLKNKPKSIMLQKPKPEQRNQDLVRLNSKHEVKPDLLPKNRQQNPNHKLSPKPTNPTCKHLNTKPTF